MQLNLVDKETHFNYNAYFPGQSFVCRVSFDCELRWDIELR